MSSTVLSALVATPSFAAGWSDAFAARLALGHEDNVRLSAADPESSNDAMADFSGNLSRHSDAVDFSLQPHLLLVRYQELPLLNRNDFDVTTALTERSERAQRTISAAYVQDTTLTSELGLTGLTESNRKHENLSPSFSATLLANERWQISSQASWSMNRYIDAQGTGLVDYNYGALSGTASYSVSERSALSVDGSYGRLVVPGTEFSTNSLAANIHWQTAVTERWKLTLAGGPTRIESKFITDNGTGYSASLHRENELGEFDFALSRDVIPTGRGVLSKRELASLSISHKFSEKFTTQLSAQWVRNQEIAPQFGLSFPVVRFATVENNWQWQFAPTLSLYMSLAYSTQRQDSIDGLAKDFRVNAGIAWHGLERRL